MPRQSFGNGRISGDVWLANHAGNQEVVAPVSHGTLCVNPWSLINVNVKQQMLWGMSSIEVRDVL